MTRLRIFYRNINLEEFIYPEFYQIWSDKTNSLRKSDGKVEFVEIACKVKKKQEI